MTLIFDCPGAADLSGDESWWSLYEDAFPLSEREPREVILRGISTGVGPAIRARDDDRVVGLATLHLLRDPPAIFMVYVALAASHRGAGVGRVFFEEAWRVGVAAHPPAQGIIWEVESPSLGRTPGEVSDRERRIRFFERCGGHVLPVAFQQPPLDGIAPVPMTLMYRGRQASEVPRTDEIARLVQAIYLEKYGGTNGIPLAVLAPLLAAARAS